MKCVHVCLSEDSYGRQFFPSTIKVLGIGTQVLRRPLTKPLTLPAHLANSVKLPQLLFLEHPSSFWSISTHHPPLSAQKPAHSSVPCSRDFPEATPGCRDLKDVNT